MMGNHRFLSGASISAYVYVCHSNIVAFYSARFVGGAMINDLHIEGHNQSHGILNDLGKSTPVYIQLNQL
jgi:hypothetical protein